MPVQELYEADFQRWVQETIAALEARSFDRLDIPNLVEELAELGRSERKALASHLLILLAHLLKLRVQGDAPEMMQGSWLTSVVEHRQRVLFDLQETPSLKSYLEEAVEKAYPQARRLAIREGKLARFGVRVPEEGEYPMSCPFGLEQVLDEDFYGNDADA
ncbi:MAG: DUF29 domain-containing protein [Prochlorothrix sp.]|nr:DUF29 domain-containing protein [Prochlorothrix sp.]